MPDLLAVTLILLYGAGTFRFLRVAHQRSPGHDRALVRVLTAAGQWAVKHGRMQMTPEDVVYVALFDRDVADAITARGGSLADLRASLAEHLASLPPKRATSTISAAVGVALGRAKRVAVNEKRAVRALDVVRSIADHPGTIAAAKLNEANVRFLEPTHVAPNSDAPLPRSVGYRELVPALCDLVVFWNDDRTTMEFVEHVLGDAFAKADVESALIMLAVHQEGAAVIGAYSPEEARERVDRANALVCKHRMALRITIEKAPFSPPPSRLWSRFRARRLASSAP